MGHIPDIMNQKFRGLCPASWIIKSHTRLLVSGLMCNEQRRWHPIPIKKKKLNKPKTTHSSYIYQKIEVTVQTADPKLEIDV